METYKPRWFSAKPVLEMSGIRLKPYTISALGPDEIELSPLADHVADSIAGSPILGTAHLRLGYLIYHLGEGANWVLTRVWMQGGIVTGLLATTQGDDLIEVTEPIIECVWEEVAAHHERNAWVRNMMTGIEDPEGYLKERLPDGLH